MYLDLIFSYIPSYYTKLWLVTSEKMQMLKQKSWLRFEVMRYSHYVTQLLTHDYMNFRQLLLNQGHHPIIHCNTAIIHIDVRLSMVLHAFILVLIQIFVKFTKLSLPLVWKGFYWFIPSFSFLSCVRIFMYFLLSLLANNAC